MNSRSTSLRALALGVLLAATPLAAVRYQAAVRDPDIWWHLRVGESIVRTHAFPHTAVFTRFAGVNPWAAYSWIFEVLTSTLYRWFSLPALPAILFILQIAIGVALFTGLAKTSRRFWPAWLLTAAAFAAFFHTLSLRPVLFSALFFAVQLTLLFTALRDRAPKLLCWMPLLFWFWANCHIQFINGLLVIALMAVCLAAQHVAARRWGVEEPELNWTSVAAVLAGCVAATLVSPYSWHLYEVVWGYASKAPQWDQIVELTAPDFRRPAHFVELLLLGGAAMALGARRGLSVFRVALLGFAAMVSLHAVRDAWFAGMVAAFLVAEWWSGAQTQEQESRLGLGLPAAGCALALALCVVAQSRIGFSAGALIAEIDRSYPVRAASFVADAHPAGPLYNSVNWGGYLIYNLREYPVAADGRSDAYGGSFGDNMKVMQGAAGWKQDPTFATSNTILVEKTSALAGLLAGDPDYRLVYSDHIAAVFVRVRR